MKDNKGMILRLTARSQQKIMNPLKRNIILLQSSNIFKVN